MLSSHRVGVAYQSAVSTDGATYMPGRQNSWCLVSCVSRAHMKATGRTSRCRRHNEAGTHDSRVAGLSRMTANKDIKNDIYIAMNANLSGGLHSTADALHGPARSEPNSKNHWQKRLRSLANGRLDISSYFSTRFVLLWAGRCHGISTMQTFSMSSWQTCLNRMFAPQCQFRFEWTQNSLFHAYFYTYAYKALIRALNKKTRKG